jgi:hypothetical protein
MLATNTWIPPICPLTYKSEYLNIQLTSRMWSSELLHCVILWLHTNILEEPTASQKTTCKFTQC